MSLIEKKDNKMVPLHSRLTAEEVLNEYYNRHLSKLISAWADKLLYGDRDPEETAFVRHDPPPGKGMLPIERKFKVKEVLPEIEKTFKNEAKVLNT